MKYEIPEMEIVELKVEDIIITSFVNGGDGTSDSEGEVIPKDDWS